MISFSSFVFFAISLQPSSEHFCFLLKNSSKHDEKSPRTPVPCMKRHGIALSIADFIENSLLGSVPITSLEFIKRKNTSIIIFY